jgi:hypothetical protein
VLVKVYDFEANRDSTNESNRSMENCSIYRIKPASGLSQCTIIISICYEHRAQACQATSAHSACAEDLSQLQSQMLPDS